MDENKIDFAPFQPKNPIEVKAGITDGQAGDQIGQIALVLAVVIAAGAERQVRDEGDRTGDRALDLGGVEVAFADAHFAGEFVGRALRDGVDQTIV